MTDYKEEQATEIEALESIYPNEFELLDDHPFHKFKIIVRSDEYDEEKEEGAAFELIFQYTKKYPDEPPVIEIIPLINLEEDSLDDLRSNLQEQCTENLGMVMVFTIVSYSLEWLNSFLDNEKRKVEEEAEEKKRRLEEIERKKFEGTRVTVESFLAWKVKFDFEFRGIKPTDGEKIKKLTGRELFIKDKTLNESDLSFFGKEDDEVAVDESLFQDLDDLNLEGVDDDDDDDDEDYVPGNDSDD